MKLSGSLVRSLTAAVLVLVMAVPFSEAAAAASPQSTPSPQTNATAPDQAQPAPNTGSPAQKAGADQQAPSPQSTSTQQPPLGTPPSLGTAAAPVENPVGVPASRPAGAAIAPARQKRTRSFAIRIAILVGAAAAIGTVVALSNASPSRPH